MVRVKCSKCGLSYPEKAGHRCPAEGDAPRQGNDNPIPFDAKQWRRDYMKKYMKEWRRRMKALKLKDKGA